MRFSRVKAAVAAFSFFLAMTGVAFASDNPDEVGKEEMLMNASSYGWELSSRTYSPDKDLEANVFAEILVKSGVGKIMQAQGSTIHFPYIVPSDDIQGAFL